MRFLYEKMSPRWKVKYHQEQIKHLRAKQFAAETEEEKEKLEQKIEKVYELREKLLK
jgi:hypothetical protein